MSVPTVRLPYHYDASPAEVFHAWTDKEAMTQWLAPSDQMTTIVDTLDFRPGGKYRINMKGPDGSDNIVIGEYIEIVENEKIVFSWEWEKSQMGAKNEQSLVTIELSSKNGGTDLVLIHEKFLTEKSAKSHEEGWQGCLVRLEKFLS